MNARQEVNPYSTAALTAIAAPVAERAAFLRRTYGLLLAGVLAFAATLWAAGNIPPVTEAALSLASLVYGSGFLGWILYAGLFLGGAMAVHAVARVKPFNLIAFFSYTLLLGLLVAPIVLVVAESSGLVIITQAALATALIFTALTGFVFVTGKDFSWLRGILFVSFIALFALGLIGALMGFSLGLAFSVLIVLLFAGYILYDTSQILHHMSTDMHVSAAVILLTDVVILFKHLLFLLSSLNRD